MKPESSLVIRRTFATSCERLFALWTQDNLLKTWFCPAEDMTIPVAETDLRIGGSYRIVMQNTKGETFSPSGVYEEIIPNKKLVFSWKWADSELVTRVTLEFVSLGESETELILTHDGFPDDEIRDRHNEGWEGCLSRLALAN